MYQIKCDQYVLYDPRDDALVVNSPKCKLEVNTVGSASFSIYSTHPYYDRLQKLRSVFEISQDGQIIFRGRMTDDSLDFDNVKAVDIEGVMAYFNDSVIRPFIFPDGFADNEDYIAASTNGNVVKFLLGWFIEQHNSQVEEFQKFKLGKVTVSDPNNYITRSSEDYSTTWEALKSKLFGSSLGGYLCIRYEDDGNYIDYVSDFELTNTQRIEYGENLLDIKTESDASATYSAMIPLGAKHNEIEEGSEDDSRLTIAGLADGDINEDLVKLGDMIFSRSAKAKYGFICVPTKDTTWDDVTISDNLLKKAVEYMSNTAQKLKNKITITAMDLHSSDEEIATFRTGRYIQVNSKPHGHEAMYKLTKLDIDILNPQNTKITLGEESQSLTDINSSTKQNLAETVASIKIQTTGQGTDISEIQHTMMEQSTAVVSTCEGIILAALENYVETSNYESFKETVQSQLQVMAEQISMTFTEMSSHIENVNGDLQEKFNTITQYFTFDVNGLTIGQTDSPYKVVIDNDRYSMMVNDMEVLWIANGRVHTPEISVTSKMNLFGYLIDQDENGNVNCDYIGGES